MLKMLVVWDPDPELVDEPFVLSLLDWGITTGSIAMRRKFTLRECVLE